MERASIVAGVRFIKVENTDADVLAWRFVLSRVFRGQDSGENNRLSFFSKPQPPEPDPVKNPKLKTKLKTKLKKINKHASAPKLNDRFLIMIGSDKPSGRPRTQTTQRNFTDQITQGLDRHFTNPDGQDPDVCVLESSVYLEEFLRQHSGLKGDSDRICQLKLKPLEKKPTLKDSINFRCQSPQLERRRLTLLANAYAAVGRYGNAITTIKLVNGTLNAATTLQSLEWINLWQKKDPIISRRFCEDILSQANLEHLNATGQLRAVADFLREAKELKPLRSTDWFEPLTQPWLTTSAPSN